MAAAFYTLDGERFVSTEHTRGPWDPDSQHAGPPAALLGRAIERCGDADTRRVARITFELLGAVPIAPVTVTAEVARPGRNVELVEASLSGPDGVAMRARAWRLRTDGIDLPPDLPDDPPPPGPAAGRPSDWRGDPPSWVHAMELSFVAGAFLEPGPATVWLRPRVALVAGEHPSPLERLLLAADAGNGVSSVLEWGRFVFINTDLTVQVSRHPRGEWVCLESVTYPQPDGVGLSDTALFDEHGRLGRATQTLLLRRR